MSSRYWRDVMVRVIFDTIEEQKGHDSIFLKNHGAGLDLIHRNLKNVTQDVSDYAKIDRQKIMDKLRRTASKAGVSSKDDFRNLYLEGVSVLDLEHLSGIFSAHEIAEAKKAKIESKNDETAQYGVSGAAQLGTGDFAHQQRRPRKKTQASTEDELDGSTSQSDFEAGEDEIGIALNDAEDLESEYSVSEESQVQVQVQDKHIGAAEEEDDTHSDGRANRRPSKKRRLNVDDTESDRTSSLSSISSESRVPDRAPISQTHGNSPASLQSKESDGDQFQSNETSYPDASRQSSLQNPGFYVCKVDECNARFISKVELDSHRNLHTELARLRANPKGKPNQRSRAIQDRQNSVDDEYILNLLRHDRTAHPMDVAKIEESLSEIQLAIHQHTLSLFTDLGIGTHAVDQFYLRKYNQSLVELLEMLYGMSVYEPDLVQYLTEELGEPLQAFELVKGLVGAAVTR